MTSPCPICFVAVDVTVLTDAAGDEVYGVVSAIDAHIVAEHPDADQSSAPIFIRTPGGA